MIRTTLVIATALALTSCSSSNNNAESNGDPVALETVGQDLLVSLAAHQVDRLSVSVRGLAVRIAASGEAMPQPESSFEILDGFGPEFVDWPSQVTVYTCNAGGQMTHEIGRLRSGVGTERVLVGDYDVFNFDACIHSEAGSDFTTGEYQLNGGLVMKADAYNVNSGSRSSHSNSWTEFSLTVPGDVTYNLSGIVDGSAFSAASFGSGNNRTTNLSQYSKTIATRTVESLEGVSFSVIQTIPNGGSVSAYELDADGIVAGPKTGGVEVTINTDPKLSGRVAPNEGVNEEFSGQISLVAANGGELILTANPTSIISVSPGDLLVDLVAQRADGESVATDAVALIDIYTGSVDNDCYISSGEGGNCETAVFP